MDDLYNLIDVADQMTDRTKPNIQFIIGHGEILVSGRPHSHIGRYQLQLENVTLSELKSVVQLLEENNIAKQVEQAYDYYGQTFATKSHIRLATPDGILSKRGVAVELKKGQITLVGDRYGMGNELTQLQTTITDAVKAVRLKKAMKQRKFKASLKYKHKEKAFILVGVQG